LPEQLRTYRLCKLIGCTPSQLEDEPAATLDWLLAIDDIYNRVRSKMIDEEF